MHELEPPWAIRRRGNHTTRHEKPVARITPEGRPALRRVQEAVGELPALRQEMARRRGFKPLTNKEIKDAIEVGCP